MLEKREPWLCAWLCAGGRQRSVWAQAGLLGMLLSPGLDTAGSQPARKGGGVAWPMSGPDQNEDCSRNCLCFSGHLAENGGLLAKDTHFK